MKKPVYEIHRANNPFFGSLIKVYDIETLANCFLYIDASKEKVEEGGIEHVNSFSICPYNNDLEKFVSYLLELQGMVGFNNLSFDSQVIQYILENWQKWRYMEGGEIAEIIYAYAQSLINNQNSMKFGLDYPEFKLTIPQLDLYKVHHFDNRAKVQSLKGLQFNLNYWRVMEMPIDHKTFIKKEELQLVEEYCINDTLSTKEFYLKSEGVISLRKRLKQLYNINCMNWSNSKIGENLCLQFYCEETNKNPKQIRQLRTHRDSVDLKDCIAQGIEFKTPLFQSLKTKFETITVTDTHSRQEISISHNGAEIIYGFGGVHSSLNGFFKEDEDHILIDADVDGFYPSFAVKNGIYPNHLGPEFVDVYRDRILNVRLAEKAKKQKGEPFDKYIMEGLKESVNSVYGKSNDKYSFLYDKKYTLTTTISCQLLITMLYEMLSEEIDCTLVNFNTDGALLMIRKLDKDKYFNICQEWMTLTNLSLEFNEFHSVFLRDVNNYCAVYKNGKTKLKGCFEIDKPLFKDSSFRIIPIALEKFVAHDIPIEETIRNHKIIWDFLGRRKFKSNMKGFVKYFKDGKYCEEETQKVTRYYVAEKGKIFVKRYSSVAGKDKFKEEVIEKGFLIELVQSIENENINDYNIDYKFYIKETQKILDSVLKPTNQLSLSF